jgi:hypothetical protein
MLLILDILSAAPHALSIVVLFLVYRRKLEKQNALCSDSVTEPNSCVFTASYKPFYRKACIAPSRGMCFSVLWDTSKAVRLDILFPPYRQVYHARKNRRLA